MTDATNSKLLDTVEIETQSNPTHAVIWLHGLGADGHDFEPIVPQLGLNDHKVRFIFPHAPVRPVTINMNMPMRAWYDIKTIDRNAVEDEAGILASAAEVRKLFEREVDRGIPMENIVLAGFSQGGAIALYAGLRCPHKLAGVLALSTYVPIRAKLADEKTAVNQDTAIFMAHGSYDPVVPFAFGELSKDLLIEQGYNVEWHSYPMEHNINFDEIRDIGQWLKKRFA